MFGRCLVVPRGFLLLLERSSQFCIAEENAGMFESAPKYTRKQKLNFEIFFEIVSWSCVDDQTHPASPFLSKYSRKSENVSRNVIMF